MSGFALFFIAWESIWWFLHTCHKPDSVFTLLFQMPLPLVGHMWGYLFGPILQLCALLLLKAVSTKIGTTLCPVVYVQDICAIRQDCCVKQIMVQQQQRHEPHGISQFIRQGGAWSHFQNQWKALGIWKAMRHSPQSPHHSTLQGAQIRHAFKGHHVALGLY